MFPSELYMSQSPCKRAHVVQCTAGNAACAGGTARLRLHEDGAVGTRLLELLLLLLLLELLLLELELLLLELLLLELLLLLLELLLLLLELRLLELELLLLQGHDRWGRPAHWHRTDRAWRAHGEGAGAERRERSATPCRHAARYTVQVCACCARAHAEAFTHGHHTRAPLHRRRVCSLPAMPTLTD